MGSQALRNPGFSPNQLFSRKVRQGRKAAKPQSDNEARQEIEDREMKQHPIFLSSIFLSLSLFAALLHHNFHQQ
jgi:hypothetical protein